MKSSFAAILIISDITICQFVMGCIPRTINNFGTEYFKDDEVAIVYNSAENIQIYQIRENEPIYKLEFDSVEAKKNLPTLGYISMVRLIPGNYKISWEVIEFESYCSWTSYVELKAGHRYLPTRKSLGPTYCVLRDITTGKDLR